MGSPGVLAVQGDFDKHALALRATGVPGERIVLVRTPEDLARVDRLIIPGGESTTVGLLLERFGTGHAIRERAAKGMPVWGTCMGMILMAREIEERRQYSLDLLDITLRRNAFGPQVHSFETNLKVDGLAEPLLGVFIRAPVVTRIGPEVKPLAVFDGSIVAVRQGNLIGTSFHPELTTDTRLHSLFLDL